MVSRVLDFISSLSPLLWLRVSFLALVQMVQFTILLSYVLSFFPTFSHVDFVPYYAHLSSSIHPKRDSQIYWLGVMFFNVMFLLIAGLSFKNTHKDIGFGQEHKKNRWAPIYWAIGIESLVAVILFMGSHFRVVGDQVISRPGILFMIGIVLMFLSKISLKWVISCVAHAHRFGDNTPLTGPPVHEQPVVFKTRWFYLFILVALFCAAGFFIPDMHALFDAAYFWERQQENELLAIAPAYWNFCGGLPIVDGAAHYGSGMAILMGQMCKLAGAFDWLGIFQVMAWLIIAYAVVWFVLYTRVFRSPLLALAVWFLFLKFRLLGNEGGALGTFVNLNASPIRFYGDVFFLAAIGAHWSSRRRGWLILAGLICATQLFLVTSIGIILCLLMGIYVLIDMLAHVGSDPKIQYKAIQDALWALALMVISYVSIMLVLYTDHLGQASFWNDYFLFFNITNNGFMAGVYLGLLFGAPGALILSVTFIMLYLLSIWPAACLILQRRFADVRPMLAVILAFYGLLHLQHFIGCACPEVIDRNVSVQLFLIFIWYDILIERRGRFFKQCLSVILLSAAVIGLFNDPKWKSYPNVFHPSARLIASVENSYLKEYFDKTYAFQEDVKLIQQLTSPQDHVALISEHEVLLLIKSHRKPFFYVFPLMRSDQIGRTSWPADQMFTMDQFHRTLDQINNQKPPVIFVERKLFITPVSENYHGLLVPLVPILQEVVRSYVPVAESPYLIAFKRKVGVPIP